MHRILCLLDWGTYLSAGSRCSHCLAQQVALKGMHNEVETTAYAATSARLLAALQLQKLSGWPNLPVV